MVWEFQILEFIQKYLTSDFADSFMIFISSLGDRGIIWIFISILLLTKKSYRETGIAMLIALIAMLLIGNMGIKPLVARPRPFQVYPEISLIIPPPHEYSFPSGHSFSSFTAATVLLWSDRKLGIPAIILALSIAFSRMYLYVHFPTDVLAGAIFGILLGTITKKIVDFCIFRAKLHNIS